MTEDLRDLIHDVDEDLCPCASCRAGAADPVGRRQLGLPVVVTARLIPLTTREPINDR